MRFFKPKWELSDVFIVVEIFAIVISQNLLSQVIATFIENRLNSRQPNDSNKNFGVRIADHVDKTRGQEFLKDSIKILLNGREFRSNTLLR